MTTEAQARQAVLDAVEKLQGPMSLLPAVRVQRQYEFEQQLDTFAEMVAGEAYDRGASDGKNAGEDIGHDEGVEEGRTEGDREGYERGKQDGFVAGVAEGHSSGLEQGRREGFDEAERGK